MEGAAADAGGKSSKRSGRHKPQLGKKFKICRACGGKKPEADFAVNQNIDFDCKRGLDNIYRQAKAQGPEALKWFAETRADPVRCKKMLESYKVACKQWCAGNKVGKVKWSFTQYKESIEASSGVRLSENQQMMWERQAVLFWQSVDGGASTEEEAQDKWNRMAARVGDPDVIYDEKGPKRKPLRIAVTREDMVYNYNDVSKKRQLEFQDKANKKSDDASISKAVKRVLSNHDNIGSSAGGPFLPGADELSQMMVKGGAGSAFDAANIAVGNVKNLLPDDVDMSDNEKGGSKDLDENDKAEKGASEDEEKEKDKDSSKWFDKDRAVNAAMKAMEAQQQKLLSAHGVKVKELEHALKTIAGLSAEEKQRYPLSWGGEDCECSAPVPQGIVWQCRRSC